MQLFLQNDPDQTEGGATQRERIPRARWTSRYRKKRDEGIQLVDKRHHYTHRRGRAAVVWAERLVVLGYRIGDRPLFAVVQRVISAHSSLQFGEFADHSGRKIGL